MADAFTLIINSSNISNRNTNAIFTYNFIGGGFTVDDDTMVMVSSAQIPYSIFNISAAYDNDSFGLRFPTGSNAGTYTYFTININDGFYTINDLNAFMQQYAIANGLYLINFDGDYVYYTPKFSINQKYYSIEILFYAVPRAKPFGWQQPANWIGYSTYSQNRTPIITIFSTNKFGDYLGFEPGDYPSSSSESSGESSLLAINEFGDTSVLSNKRPPIGSYVNSIIIHCSLVNNPVVSPSDILDAFHISNTKFGENINYNPSVKKFVKLTKGTYSSMIIYLTDQNYNPITLIDPNILITLLFKKIK